MASLGVKAEPGQASPKLASPQQLTSGRGLKPMAQQVNLQKVDATGHEFALLGQYEIQGEPKVVSPVQKKEESKEVEARSDAGRVVTLGAGAPVVKLCTPPDASPRELCASAQK